jgi:signal transduction histidine kinase
MGGLLTRLRLPATVQDVLLAGFVAYFQIRGTLFVGPDDPAHALARHHAAGYLLLAGTGLALAARRRYPTAVFAALSLASVVYYLAGYPDGPGWISLFIATYTLAAYGDGRRSTRLIAATLVSLTVVWLLTADLSPLNGAGWVFFRIGTAIMAATLGESVRTKRVVAEQATQRAELAEQTREIEARQRVDAERLRIARDVHDTVAHSLAIINVHAGVTAHTLDKHPERALETLRTIAHTSAQAISQLSTTLGMLRDQDDDRSPTPGLGQLDHLTTIARDAGLTVTIDLDDAVPDLPAAVDHTAYRILQESVTNVIRHAAATDLTISIRHYDGNLRVAVTDNGRGHDPRGGTTGHGIEGMRERATLLGGRLTTSPRPGGGFRVHADLPLASELALPR